MTTQCDPESLKPFNNNNTCVSCTSLFPNCRECEQTEPTKPTCKVCKVPFTGLDCSRDCTEGFIQLNASNCQPYTVAYPAEDLSKNVCTGGKFGALTPEILNGDLTCTCKPDKDKDPRHFSGPNCDRRKQGLNCNGMIVPVCASCSGGDCGECPPGTQNAKGAKFGCCNNGCKTCQETSGTTLFEEVPFPPSVCTSCDPDSRRSVLVGTNCVACEDAIDNCSGFSNEGGVNKTFCTQAAGGEAQCIKCKGRLTGPKCLEECKKDQVQFNIAYCQSSTCLNSTQCNGNGKCELDGNDMKCVCDAAFQGENCTEPAFSCNVANCEKCSVADVCETCKDQYKLSGNTCTAKSCQEIFPNCSTCDGTVPSMTCQKCSGAFTGATCEASCESGQIQFHVDKCQSSTCVDSPQCSSNGNCRPSSAGNNECQCNESKAGINCENDCDSSCLTCGQIHTECTSCPLDKFLLDKKCVSCSEIPNCNGCSQTTPTAPIICETCQKNFTGESCNTECPEGQIQYEKSFCQSTSCLENPECSGEGVCQIKNNDNVCRCNADIIGSNCDELSSSKKCGGKEIKNCTGCQTTGNQCKTCFRGAKLSDDGLACCALGCHSCSTANPNVCIGCDKESDKPFYESEICKTCAEIYPNCLSCKQITFFSKVTCTNCKEGFTGETCDRKCEDGQKSYGLNGCQSTSCDSHLPCRGDGTCEITGNDLLCKCVSGVTGSNCEITPPCAVENCDLCDLTNSQVCTKCVKDFKLNGGNCTAMTCQESIINCQSGCQGQPGSFICGQCKGEFTGVQCDVSCGEGMKQYESSKCQSGSCDETTKCNGNGTCEVNSDGNNFCTCNEEFSGPNCGNTCESPCKTCQTDNKATCLSCYTGDIISGNTCTNCQRSFPNCAKCSDTNPLTCEECLPQYTEADCSFSCPIGTIPYNKVGCQPSSCITPNPCHGNSECIASGNGLKCKCKTDVKGPNCEINNVGGKTCDGYKIMECIGCTGGKPNRCALCGKGYVLNTEHTECCDGSCKSCEMRAPTVCTACPDNTFLVDGKCVSCATIPNCAECAQAAPGDALTCNICVKTLTGKTCEKDCGKGKVQFGVDQCQPASCGKSKECDGNGTCEISGSEKVCNCQPLFSGINCEIVCKVVGCASCVPGTSDTCSKCISGYHEENGKCIQDVPLVCAVQNCEYCVSGTTNQCQKCYHGYHVNGNNCVKDAPPHCNIHGCAECNSDSVTCKTCDAHLVLSSDKKKCENCVVQNCYECQNRNPHKCSICFQNFSPESNCSDCKDGYYNLNGNCANCADNCRKCDRNGCYQCQYGFQVVDGVCKGDEGASADKLSVGGIIGIVIAILVVIGIIIAAVLFMKVRKAKLAKKSAHGDAGLINSHQSGSMVAMID